MSGITRRQFAGGGAGLASALLLPQRAAATTRRAVTLGDGTAVTALGQGSARIGQGKRPAAEEEDALALGLSLGLTLIDTAEIYGGGKAETLIGRAIAGRRDGVFLVSKVWPSHATPAGIRDACTASLARLGTDHLDLYLLHWRREVKDLAGVVAAFERLRADGLIRRWGVSNFGVADMDELYDVPSGQACAINQVPYSLANRAIERDLLPWCARYGMPVMAYSPLGGHGSSVLQNPLLSRISKPLFEALLAAFAHEAGAGPHGTIILLLDGAGWHTQPGLRVPDGLRLVYLPPYTPELQPAEHLWRLVDEPIVNRHFDRLTEIQDRIEQRCRDLEAQQDIVRANTLFRWWPQRPIPS